MNENRACCGKGLPFPLPVPFLSAGSFLKERLKCVSSRPWLLKLKDIMISSPELNFTPANLTGKTNLAPSNFDWY